ncbi:MAG TPA: hypothetical protein VL173_00515 [Vicinamibacterales bacterium]|nr:hypothetical protein [Vicinamibacterales bacterium]
MRDSDHAGREINVVPGFGRADASIDAAARDLTRGEPSPQLRQAVRARIETRRAWWVERAWVYGFASAAALVIVAVIVARGLSNSPEEPARVRSAQVAHVEPPRVEQVPPPPPTANAPRVARAPRRQAPVRNIEIDPLVIEPLVVPRLTAGTSSGVMPIEIDPLQIVPLQQQ